MSKTGCVENLVQVGRERFQYDDFTGNLVWRDPGQSAFASLKGYRIFKRKFAGKVAGHINSDGYVRVYLQGRSVLAHRIIWAIVYGRDPANDIDHRDMCRSNNRLDNLREATRSQNCMNKYLRSDNASGVKGVHWHKASQKWAAAICINGHNMHLGLFRTKELAENVRCLAAKRLHGEFSRTSQ
jgi:hypothetical protein